MIQTDTERLPKILVIDDQFGRCGLGMELRRAVAKDVFAGYEADRRNLCLNYGLIDATGDIRQGAKPINPIAEAIFCPGQVWNGEKKRIDQSAETAVRMTGRGWPFANGTRWALVLLDLRFVHGRLNAFGDPQEGSMFGAEVLLPELRAKFGEDLPIVVLSSTSKDENNAAVRRLGALDFIQRVPGAGPAPEKAREALQQVLSRHGLLVDSSGLVVGRSLPVLKMLRQARRGAASARNILLLGETGTGKGLLAEYIHSISLRRNLPFEVFHAAHRPADLQADELFGHWKGAFTGAVGDAPGVWERADGGTLFIDEVAAIDSRVQEMLMQPIEERRVRRLGSPVSGSAPPKQVDVLVILATNQKLSTADRGNVKLDFLNRINAFTIEAPPLRDRREDLSQLLAHLTDKIARHWRGQILPDAIEALKRNEWREGNIRQLRNVIERALVENPDQDITAADLHLPNQLAEARVLPEPGAEWQRFCQTLNHPPGALSVAEAKAIRQELGGTFLDLLARTIEWSLEVTQEAGKPNLTACARFLLGRNNISTMEAKQFFKKLLTLDTRGRTIAQRLRSSRAVQQHETLAMLVRQILKDPQ